MLVPAETFVPIKEELCYQGFCLCQACSKFFISAAVTFASDKRICHSHKPHQNHPITYAIGLPFRWMNNSRTQKKGNRTTIISSNCSLHNAPAPPTISIPLYHPSLILRRTNESSRLKCLRAWKLRPAALGRQTAVCGVLDFQHIPEMLRICVLASIDLPSQCTRIGLFKQALTCAVGS